MSENTETPEAAGTEQEKPEADKTEESAADKSVTADEDEDAVTLKKPENPGAAIEAVLFANGNSVAKEKLCEILNLSCEELDAAVAELMERYAQDDRGINITELDDALQLGTKGEYYEYLIKLSKSAKQYSLSDTVIETLSIIAYKQPVTRAQIESIRGVSSDHAINRLLEYELIEEVGRLEAPGKPLLFGTTEQFLRSFGVKNVGELPTISAEMMEDFKQQAEAEAGVESANTDDESVTVEV
ncbi:MAG: SMC-Scp complex subunit ScpB [Lachnospiraceae bacterium]|nr:SMC-Scp complex subunit ScpB [Lachnospiraceae bacterium]